MVSYRTYRLTNRQNYVPRAENCRVKNNTTYLAQALGNFMSSGTKTLAVLDFLSQYTLQFRDIGLSENEAYISIRIFLRPTALELFNSSKAIFRDGEVIYSVVQYP